jgi:hypothetical protein
MKSFSSMRLPISAMAFALQIRKKYAGSIYLVDERYSTVSSSNKLRELGITPPRPKENYDLPIVVQDMVTAYELASFIENRLIGIYIQLYVLEEREYRLETLQYALDGSLRILEFKQTPLSLPGSIS